MLNAVVLYRISRWCFLKKIPIIPKIIQGIIFIIYGCHISYKCHIGKNTSFLHKGMGTLILEGVYIGSNTKIGMNVLITGKSPFKKVPRIKDNVWISPGAIISGPVTIEDNVIIASNSVVTKSVPEGAIVAGIPGKIIGWKKNLNYDPLLNEDWDLSNAEYMKENQ